MSIPGAMGLGGGPGGGLRFAATRGRMGGSLNQGVNYPSPFFDIAHTYLPITVKSMFRWCRYYFLTNPIINATVFKLSEYPITEIMIDHEDKSVARRWKEYFEDHLNYRAFQIECGLDYNTYGNCLTSLSFPFKKYLICEGCKHQAEAKRIRPHWVFTNYEFRLSCPKCGHLGTARSKDIYFKNESGIRPMRWSPEDVEISYSDLTGEYTYFYNIPPGVRNDVIIGKKDAVEQVPEIFIQALRNQKGVTFSKDLFFHLRRPTLADQDRGWGIPLLLPCLKDTFYLQVMKKAQEAILLEHIVPLRILFPQAGSGTSDPYCVSPDTLVETFDGIRPASEIRPGDYLRSHTGAWRQVLYEKRRPVRAAEKVFELSVCSMPAFPFVVSEEHPILAVPSTENGHGRKRQRWVEPTFIEAHKLKVGDYVAYPVDTLDTKTTTLDLASYLPEHAATEEYIYLKMSQGAAEAYEYELARDFAPYKPGPGGERQEVLVAHGWTKEDWCTAYSMRDTEVVRIPRYMEISEELATLVGYYLAEGSVGTGGIVNFSFHENETAYHADVERCVLALGFAKGVRIYPNSVGRGVDVRVGSVLLSEILVGLCGKGFAHKTIPHELVDAGRCRVVAMLRALFAGDGWDSSAGTTNVVGLGLSNPHVIVEARRLLLSFGLIGVISKEEPGDYELRKTASYKLAYNGAQADNLRLLFAGGELSAGSSSKGRPPGVFRGGYALVPIRAITEVENVPEVIGFQMEGDQSFCVPSCAHHNTTINLVDWRDHVATEIARWRMDNNYIPILPLPVGNQTIGGDGRALLMVNEMQQIGEQLINGMQVPLEFIKGGLSYAGTNVSMRMLENQFIIYLSRHKRMAQWAMRQIADYLDWPLANIRFKPFKMADDIQRKAFLFQLNQANKVSDTTLLADSDMDQEKEDQIMERETAGRMEATKKQQLAQAELQGEQQVIVMKMQAKAQQEMQAALGAPTAPGEPGGPETSAAPPGGQGGAPTMPASASASSGAAAGGTPTSPMVGMSSPLNAGQNMGMGSSPAAQQTALGGSNILAMAQTIAMNLQQQDPAQQHLAIKKLREQSPELADLVLQYLKTMVNGGPQMGGAPPAAAGPGDSGVGANGKAAVQIDMRPQPDKLPARRAAAAV